MLPPPAPEPPPATAVDTQAPRASVEPQGILTRTVGDEIRIRGVAEDDDRVASITLFVDGRSVKTCAAWECWYSEVVEQPGPRRYRAEALDSAGNRGVSDTVEFMVHPSAKPGPALTVRTDPYQPTDRDRVRFMAEGSHRSGVRDVTIHIQGAVARTCASARCEHAAGPFPAGTVRWRVSARSRDGGETYGSDNALEIRAAPVGPATGSCAIAGRALGPRVDVASLFIINLYGPDDDRRFREAGRFGTDGRYRFEFLPEGRYRLVPDSPAADMAVGAHPDQRIVDCRDMGVTGADFEFR